MLSDYPCACDHDTPARFTPLLAGLALGLCTGVGIGLWIGVSICGRIGG